MSASKESTMRLPEGKSTLQPLGKAVTTPLTVQKFTATSSNIAGTSTNLQQSLKEIEADLKRDIAGRKEYSDYLKSINDQKRDLQKRIDANKKWIEHFENNDSVGAFEMQYKKLVDQIQTIYESAKDSHAKGIDLLIKEFDYHVTYKRWNDTFNATPFIPK